MKRLALLCLLAVSACGQLPTQTASHAPTDRRAEGGMTMGGGQRQSSCYDASGQSVPC
jgi:hypothetical protein